MEFEKNFVYGFVKFIAVLRNLVEQSLKRIQSLVN